MIKKFVKSKIMLISLILIVIVVYSDTGLAQRFSRTTSTRAGTGMSPQMKSVFRSLLFPGLGQLNNNQKTKSYIFMGVGAVLLGTTLYMGISQNSLWKDYEASLTESDYNSYKSRVHTANIFIGITVAFWAYNIVDAYIGAKKTAAGPRKYQLRRTTSYTPSEGTSTPEKEKYVTCPKCGAKVKAGAKFCPECGAKMPQKEEKAVIRCPKCGAEVDKNAKFCPECGAKLK